MPNNLYEEEKKNYFEGKLWERSKRIIFCVKSQRFLQKASFCVKRAFFCQKSLDAKKSNIHKDVNAPLVKTLINK